MQKQSSPHRIGVFTLIMITSALFMTLRNFPMMAETGLQMIFFNLITVFAFLIPIALVSAELATGWPHNGVYFWVKEAFGPKLGFIAVWLQWAQSIFGIPAILAYVAASLGAMINPELSRSNHFIVATIFIVYWGATLANLKGTKLSGRISSICVLAGVFFPTLLLIGLGIFYVLSGNPIQLDLSLKMSNFIPSLHSTNSFILFLSFIFGFVGMEVSASHAREVKDPQTHYPIAIFVSAIIGFTLTLLGGLAIAVIVPKHNIDLVAGAVQAFRIVFNTYHVGWIFPISAFLVAFGAAGQVSTWVVGPIKGLWSAGREGHLPPALQESNKNGIPRNLLIIQACLISSIGLVFLFVPNLNSMFLVLANIAVLLYSIMYCMMFASIIRLRHSQPDTPRAYKVPGGKPGVWIIAGIGFFTTLACFVICFIPVSIKGLPVSAFETLVIAIAVAASIMPIAIFKLQKPNWIPTN